jgi:flagellar FliJ protein
MKPFKLQSVLDYRKRIEKMAQKSILIYLEKQSSLDAEKQKRQKELLKLFDELQSAEQKGTFLPEVMLYEKCIHDKKRGVEEIARKLEGLSSEINCKKDELIKARQEKRTLEILKEKNEEKEKRKQRHRENIFSDEAAILGLGERK